MSALRQAGDERLGEALVIAPAWIGDAVLAQPLFKRLSEHFPGRKLDALAPAWVAPVLARMPEIRTVIDSPFAHGDLALGSRWRLARQLASKGYEAAYVLPNSLKSALIPWLAGIPARVGFTGESRYGLINRRHRLDRAALPTMAERFAQLAEPPGGALPRPLPLPALVSTPGQQAAALAALQNSGQAQLGVPGKRIAFCPGAEYGPAKRWPPGHFAALARALAERGYTIWLLGSDKDRPAGAAIAAAAPQSCVNLCGATALSQAIDLLALVDLVVCNDSGLMHIAAALGRPLVALYGSSSPGFTPPLSRRAVMLRLPLECSPCFRRECPLGHLNCLEQLDPGRVLAACLDQMIP